ncbi:hypothetical protein Krac_12412 [Ktedonobacter racemifer DSM 44963]|uniref:Uncharacterized protein n=1 Tax=Ktedonobacter racemifer DSM 44963 TaxID=485913 RepID=D6TH35_KTERA|nr:hypothetical protein Krac_12412 [Ktedonobacter racemifer DSM 44963]
MSDGTNEPLNAAFNEAEVSHSEAHAACFNMLCRSDIPLIIKRAMTLRVGGGNEN